MKNIFIKGEENIQQDAQIMTPAKHRRLKYPHTSYVNLLGPGLENGFESLP